MSNCFCEINISDIDLTDQRYKLSYDDNDDISFLAHSIRESGLTSPPAVRPLNNRFVVIFGFNRIRAQLFNNETKIVVYKTGSDTSDFQCHVKSITALAFKRPLTQYELIISCKRLAQFLNENDIAKKSSAIFNTELNARYIEDLLTIGRLPDPALELIQCSHLSLKSARRMSSYGTAAINCFLTIFSIIKASSSKQHEIMLHLMEISARDSIKPEEILKNQNIQEILLDDDKDAGLKTNLMRAWLFEKRFPTICKTNQNVRRKIASIKLGTIKFTPPENFEAQHYSISFKAKNYNELKANIQKLTDALENQAFKEIFN